MSQGKDNKTGVEGMKRKRGRPPKLRVIPSNHPAPASQDGSQATTVVPLVRGQGKSPDGLTIKQNAFAEHVAAGSTLAAAYRAAYDAAGMSAGAIHTEASKLMSHPAIARRINAVVQERMAKTSHDAARIRAHVIERLHLESIDPDSSPAARVRALELLGKLDIVQVFKDKQAESETAQDKAELAATLEARLKALLAKTA